MQRDQRLKAPIVGIEEAITPIHTVARYHLPQRLSRKSDAPPVHAARMHYLHSPLVMGQARLRAQLEKNINTWQTDFLPPPHFC
ncbi:MAG: hypothetical protein AWU55_3043 [Halomonadaceae bacterium T82-2]|nr:MAG: hypothetical protein AWU55_3043 [Halomonadaceae bacterium T82-2]